MTTPGLLRLREAVPQVRLTLLAPEKLADLWRPHPAIDDVMSFAPGESVFRVARRLRTERFELALILPNSPRSALESWLAGIPTRVGVARPWRNWMLTRVVPPRTGVTAMRKRTPAEIQALVAGGSTARNDPPSADSHQIFDYLHLVTALGARPDLLPPLIQVTAEELVAARRKFALESSPTVPLLGLNPGAEYGPAKRWPADRFAAVAVAVGKQAGCRWAIFGGRGDQALAAEISERITAGLGAGAGAGPRVINLAGKTNLRDLCAALQSCRLVLTNDTGPMHLAAAVGTPVVVPYGSTSPELTGPGLPGDPRHRLLKTTAPCAPCFLRECPIDFRCMNGHEVEEVTRAILDVVKMNGHQ